VVGRFTFGGAGQYSGTAQDLQTLIADECILSTKIPAGAKFWISIYYTNAAGIPFVYTDSTGADQANGDIAQYAGSGVPNVTASGAALTNTQNSVGYYPVLLLAKCNNRAFGLHGDSIMAGRGDSTADNTGHGGFGERAVGPWAPYINMASSGASADSLAADTGYLRRQLLTYVDAVIMHAGINNVTGGASGQTIVGLWDKARKAAPAQDFYISLMTPNTTGAWAAADGSDQTVTGNDGLRVTGNNIARGLQNAFTGVLDTDAAVRNTTVQTKWKAGRTADGIHPTQTGHIEMAAVLPRTALGG
jgi:lysophospholipase L1-like esterase